MSIYLDYNATSPIDQRVLKVMVDVYTNVPGNSDSRTHDFGNNARKVVEESRASVASLFGINSDEVIFTSGATESNNIAIQGLIEYGIKNNKKHIITTAIEHKAVLNTVKYLGEQGFDVEFIKPDQSGRINEAEVLKHVKTDTLLVSMMHVNNETGIIQPVKEIGKALYDKNVFFHVDATQSCGKLVDEIRDLKYDMLSCSVHKFRGPQGIGVLVLRKKNYKFPPVKPIYFGGQQEHGIRPGTTPVALVAGAGEACRIASLEYKKNEENNKEIKKILLQILDESGIKYSLNGDQRYCVDSTMNICFEGVSSEALMITTKHFCAISNGSACTSKSYDPSYVLVAMGLPIDRIESSVRISWGPGTEKELIKDQFKELVRTAKKLSM